MTCLKHEASGGRHSRVNGRDSSTTFPFPPVLAPLRLSSASSRLCPPPFPSSSPSSASFLPSRRRGGEKVQAAALLPMPTSSTLAAAVVTSAGGGGRAPRPCCQGFGPPRRDWWRRNARPAGYKRQGLRCKRAKARARAAARADWVSRGRCWVELGAALQPQLCDGHYSSLLSSRRHCRLYRGTGGMIRPVFNEKTKSLLWCSWSRIYGVSEGPRRVPPGSARPLWGQVNCRNSLLLHQEAPIGAVILDTEVWDWNH